MHLTGKIRRNLPCPGGRDIAGEIPYLIYACVSHQICKQAFSCQMKRLARIISEVNTGLKIIDIGDDDTHIGEGCDYSWI